MTESQPPPPGRPAEITSTTLVAWGLIGFGIVLGIVLFFASPLLFGRHASPAVIAYCAQDQVYAEPVFAGFKNSVGVPVRPVFDSEAVKTTGLANRLLAERSNPQCDVFWGNEEMRTRQLAAEGVFRETNGWAAFGYRSRRVVINTNLLSLSSAPRSLMDLTNAAWRGKVAFAFPQFGTTATHFHALRQLWGQNAWSAWCRAMAANKPFVVDGNSVVVKLVGKGEAALGLTDSDDICAGQREGLPIVALPIGPETLLIPNTVAVARGAPHPLPAQKLFDYLQTPAVLKQLIAANALEGESPETLQGQTLKPNWAELLRDLDHVTQQLNTLFLR